MTTTTYYSAAPSTLDHHRHDQPHIARRGWWHRSAPTSTIDIRDARRTSAERLGQQWVVR